MNLQTDGSNSFLRAARAGNLDKVLEYLKGSIDINTSNVVSFIRRQVYVCHTCFDRMA